MSATAFHVEDVAFASEPRAAAAVTMAREGGRIALDRFQRARVAWKADESMVTDADHAIQRWLQGAITATFPEDDVLGEEEVGGVTRNPGARHTWILDPIDGTNNFGRGVPGFAISVGIFMDGRPLGGVVYDPLGDQLFAGCRGRGSWLNGRRLRVEPRRLGAGSLFSIRSPYPGQVPAFVQQWLVRYRLRRFGSTALQLCYVAAGALAFLHDHRASLWDVAGALPILLEAGAIATGPEGEALFPIAPARYHEPVALLAGDPLGHAQALRDVVGAGR
jgi:myo-inositol-1(or 4)-monophosphatase